MWSHRPAETIVKEGGTSYVFVAEGIDVGLLSARKTAGSDDVRVNGVADNARQYLAASLIDELRLHLVPTMLGASRRLFDERPAIVELPAAPKHGADGSAVLHWRSGSPADADHRAGARCA